MMDIKRTFVHYNNRDAEITPGTDVLRIARQWDIDPFECVDVLTAKGITMIYGYTCTRERYNEFKRRGL